MSEEAAINTKNRTLMALGLVFFLVAATLVVVAQNTIRPHESRIIIPAGH